MKISNFLFKPKTSYKKTIEKINLLEEKYSKITDEELKNKGVELKEKIQKEEISLEDALPDAFAIVREASWRSLHQKHYDVQLMGGIAMFEGKIAEMRTGEGKTLAATAPVFLRALTGKGVHVITVNDYLAQRDAVWMGQVYYMLGLSVSCIIHEEAFLYDPDWKIPPEEIKEEDEERDELGSFKVQKDFLRPVSRKEAYLADITYGTNNEFGFDYLRDNLSYDVSKQVQRKHYFAVIDEVDSVLIDEARTPLIISAPDKQAGEYYKLFAKVSNQLKENEDYEVDEKVRAIQITDEGVEKVQRALNIENLYVAENMKLVHYLDESLKAKSLFQKDKQYVVKNGEIVIVDEFTGRMMPGRRYSGGLHQAIEAKEGVAVKEESKTFAKVTIQNYFHLYEFISGMTGTAETSSEEFEKVYGLQVVEIPTNKPMIRKDLPDFIYKSMESKYGAIIEVVKEKNEKGQPILIGTTSIDENELLSRRLSNAGLKHEALNAKNHEREGEIIAQAGKLGSITLATNMAGRGVDIVLGGNPKDKNEFEKVKELGGLFVLGTQRNESRRIDNQLRGRAGRQGDEGETRFFLSLEDDMLRIFGGERIQNMMTRFNFPEDQPLESKTIVKIINEAQKKVEGINFDMRKHLLEYDNVLDKQRKAVYRRRQNILQKIEKDKVKETISETILGIIKERIKLFNFQSKGNEYAPTDKVREDLLNWMIEIKLISSGEIEKIDEEMLGGFKNDFLPEFIKKKIDEMTDESQKDAGIKILNSLDIFWTNHLDNLEALLESVRIRAYGQKDPLVEYKRDSYEMFKNLIASAEEFAISAVFAQIIDKTPKTTKIDFETIGHKEGSGITKKIGRNDPCWCGSGKKYKKCHGA